MKSVNFVISLLILYEISCFLDINQLNKNLVSLNNFLANNLQDDTNKYFKGLLKSEDFHMNKIDPLSYSNTDEILQNKILFDIEIDMNGKKISGFVRIFYDCLKKTKEFFLDFKTLRIIKVIDENSEKLNYSFIKKTNISSALGKGLKIELKNFCIPNKNKFEYIDIYYTTTNKSIALHFSDPSMLEDKKYAFMYTHGPAIFSRSLFPCQDTPFAKIKTEANIVITKPYTVLFSGLFNSEKNEDNVNEKNIEKNTEKNPEKNEFHFTNEIPISTYLVSIAAGKFDKKLFGEKCLVYAEGDIVNTQKTSETFKNCSKYIDFYENKIFKNKFKGKMTFIILPDDFPYAGMENPYNIQIAKSVLTNDGSYSSVIAHEIAHFWSGNLVTNKTWEHFWLNEGLTNYLYKKCFQNLYGQQEFNKELNKSQTRLDKFFHREKFYEKYYEKLDRKSKSDKSYLTLWPKIKKSDPYENYSLIPYEKGFSFLYYLETRFGEDFMFSLLRSYFKKFKFCSATSEDFIELLEKKIKQKLGDSEGLIIIESLKIKEWINGTGNIPVKFNIESKILKNIEKFVEKIKNLEISKKNILRKILKRNNFYKNLILSLINSSRNKVDKENRKKFRKNIKYVIRKLYNLKDKNLLEISTEKKLIFLKVNFMKSKKLKKKILLKNLMKFKYYHIGYLRAVINKLRHTLNVDKKEIFEIIFKIKHRLNKLTLLRLTQYINKN